MPKSEPVPEGTYSLRCDKADYKESKEKKRPMAECMFTIFGPPEAEQYHGRKIFDNLMLSGDGLFRLRSLLEASGEDDDFVFEDTDQLVGREVAATIGVEPERKDPVSGQVYTARNKVTRYLPIK
jgi:hypothetical protein